MHREQRPLYCWPSTLATAWQLINILIFEIGVASFFHFAGYRLLAGWRWVSRPRRCDSGPRKMALSGNVTFKGAPLKDGTITFIPLTTGTQSGTSIQRGKYVISAEKGAGRRTYHVASAVRTGMCHSDPKTPKGISAAKFEQTTVSLRILISANRLKRSPLCGRSIVIAIVLVLVSLAAATASTAALKSTARLRSRVSPLTDATVSFSPLEGQNTRLK